MTQRTILLLVLAALGAALVACGGDDPPGSSECQGDNNCLGETPGGADGDEPDAGVGTPGTKPDGSAASSARGDAAVGVRKPDAGVITKDGSTPVSPADGGAPVASGDVKPSVGCGAATPTAGTSTIDVMGTSREYILTLPKSYDPSKPYKLVFAWHGQGGTAAQVAKGYYGLQSQSGDSTIFATGQGLTTSNSVGTGAGWPNTNGQDVAFVKALYARLQTQVCFDESRVFSVGMSYGGIMSDTLGCQMGDVFRAIAPMSGMGPGYGGRATGCVGQVAVWMSHGDNDTVVPTAQGEASRDYWVSVNHCQKTTAPVDPSPCAAYAGCDEGNPVTWCEFPGGHIIPTFAPKAIWTFFSQF